jgi:predicted AAA+ superfamily ATPase
MDEHLFQDATERGLTAQTVAMNHAARLQYYLTGHKNAEVNYWQPLDQSAEVDLVFRHTDYLLPIEVKYTDKISGGDRKGLYKFMEEFDDADFGIIITKDKIGSKNNIYYIPLWIFCLIS